MTLDLAMLSELTRLMHEGASFVLVTVVEAKGSTPRDVGARMIWFPDGAIIGTIGGGELEELAREHAHSCFETGISATERLVLGTDADQCCGGAVTLLFERHGARHTVLVFGAGHVAHELTPMLEPAPIDIHVVDDRPDWLTEERFPRCRRISSFDDGIRLAARNPASTYACVMTCSHDRDFELLTSLLRLPLAFVGLIGSDSKRSCFARRLTGAGIGEAELARLTCPIGIGDTGKEPRLVAVSIAGQLLLETKRRVGR